MPGLLANVTWKRKGHSTFDSAYAQLGEPDVEVESW